MLHVSRYLVVRSLHVVNRRSKIRVISSAAAEMQEHISNVVEESKQALVVAFGKSPANHAEVDPVDV